MKKIKINQLRAFVAVADEGGYRQAAARLKVTQPAISQAINTLEASLQKQLFVSKQAKFQLTPHGEKLLVRARAFLTHHDELFAFMFQTEVARLDMISVATQPSIAQQLLPEIIQSFMQTYPLAKINVRDTTIYHVNQLVADNKVDFAICTTHDADESFEITPICRDQYGVVAQQNHVIFQREKLTWKDLRQFSIIQNSTWDPADVTQFNALDKLAQMRVSNMNSLVTLLETGQSVTILPRLAFPERNANLRFVPLENPAKFRQIGLVKRPDTVLNESAQNLYQFILQNYR